VETADVVIAGAGIIGLSLALDLAAPAVAGHRLRVIVLERGRAMAESSWAAAGMLAANDPENLPQLTELAQLSLRLYPGFLTQIEQLSGRKVPMRTKATIQAVTAATHFAASDNRHIRELSRAELHALVPDLLPNDRDFLLPEFLLLDEPSLDPRDLCAALPAAAIAAGVKLLEHSPVISLDAEMTRVVARTPSTAIAAAHFINCAGAWAESPALGRLPHNHPRVAPAKGQMVTVRLRGPEALTHVLRTPEIYLVPRGDGIVIVGATVERAGFDKTVEPHAIVRLFRAAAELWPPVADAEIVESWAGLRPVSTDEHPLIGNSTHPSCWVATGHFRNGILLAPGTARALSQSIRGETPEIDLAPFNPSRLGTRHLDYETRVHSTAAV